MTDTEQAAYDQLLAERNHLVAVYRESIHRIEELSRQLEVETNQRFAGHP